MLYSRISFLAWRLSLILASILAGATRLARSPGTACQAFRGGERAWGLYFHAEPDARLVDPWLAEPSMVAEAREALDPQAERLLSRALRTPPTSCSRARKPCSPRSLSNPRSSGRGLPNRSCQRSAMSPARPARWGRPVPYASTGEWKRDDLRLGSVEREDA